jgi:DGQHR domain-containing protein
MILMTSRTYSAIEVSQRPGTDPFYLFSCKASDLLEWADAPRKRVEVRAGYQRDLDDRRVKRISKFLELDTKNILPSAVLVALRPGSYTIAKSGEGPLVNITVELPDSDASSCRTALEEDLFARLSAEERAVASNLAEAEAQAEDDVEAESEDSDGDGAPPPSYFAALAAEVAGYNNLAPERKAQIDDFVVSYAKPGLILDGQHRVFGAKEYEDVGVAIDMPVVLLPGLATSEQVFHFYILNNTAKPLDKRQLRSIISTSLSRREIDDLYARFDQARVDPEQAQWTYRVNTDPESPFRGLINFGLRGEVAPLDDNVMDQVVTAFVKLPRKYSLLVEGVPQWGSDSDSVTYRLSLFYALWDAVRSTYPAGWQKGIDDHGQLFYKVALLKLQEYILETLKSARAFVSESPFASPEQLKSGVAKALERLPEAFFLKEWKMKSLDTRDGHDFFLRQIREVIEGDGKNVGNRRLFKATS